jgi:GAF domain-containing protein
MRTVYRGENEENSCPVCSSPLVITEKEAKIESHETQVEPALVPDNEDMRLAAVNRYDILDSPPDGAFDRITRLAARIFDVPIATITVVDHDRIWFKSKHGIDAQEIGRDPGLCASAVLAFEPWIVNDAATDPRTLENPLVRGELGLRFYAGAPLKTADGYSLGTLNIIDTEPRELSKDDLETLKELAEVVVDELELRLAAIQLNRAAEEQGIKLAI